MTLMLEVRDLRAGYGDSRVLFGVNLAIRRGQVVTLLGRNGMGKTTTVWAIMGDLRRSGSVLFEGREISGLSSYQVCQAGIGLVPEGRRIFPNLTVRENLLVTAANREHVPDPWTLDKVVSLFPSLGRRLDNFGNQLSGGEQQMLAIGRALMTNPKLLILDEATEGLAPKIRAEIWSCLERLKAMGQSILVIDKNIAHITAIADYHYVLRKGAIVWEGTSAQLLGAPAVQKEHLGI
jgi:branched-chain amino acid transport system ATP-binding protein